ncbi:MAG TPA: hypothetical protein VGF17_20655 [Phytomonospora sp.]
MLHDAVEVGPTLVAGRGAEERRGRVAGEHAGQARCGVGLGAARDVVADAVVREEVLLGEVRRRLRPVAQPEDHRVVVDRERHQLLSCSGTPSTPQALPGSRTDRSSTA